MRFNIKRMINQPITRVKGKFCRKETNLTKKKKPDLWRQDKCGNVVYKPKCDKNPRMDQDRCRQEIIFGKNGSVPFNLDGIVPTPLPGLLYEILVNVAPWQATKFISSFIRRSHSRLTIKC